MWLSVCMHVCMSESYLNKCHVCVTVCHYMYVQYDMNQYSYVHKCLNPTTGLLVYFSGFTDYFPKDANNFNTTHPLVISKVVHPQAVHPRLHPRLFQTSQKLHPSDSLCCDSTHP